MGIDNCGIQVDTEGRRLSFGFSNGMKTMEPRLSNPIGGMLWEPVKNANSSSKVTSVSAARALPSSSAEKQKLDWSKVLGLLQEQNLRKKVNYF